MTDSLTERFPDTDSDNHNASRVWLSGHSSLTVNVIIVITQRCDQCVVTVSMAMSLDPVSLQ